MQPGRQSLCVLSFFSTSLWTHLQATGYDDAAGKERATHTRARAHTHTHTRARTHTRIHATHTHRPQALRRRHSTHTSGPLPSEKEREREREREREGGRGEREGGTERFSCVCLCRRMWACATLFNNHDLHGVSNSVEDRAPCEGLAHKGVLGNQHRVAAVERKPLAALTPHVLLHPLLSHPLLPPAMSPKRSFITYDGGAPPDSRRYEVPGRADRHLRL